MAPRIRAPRRIPDQQRTPPAPSAADVAERYDQITETELMLLKLHDALDHARRAVTPKTAARIRLAISSAKGAERNAGYRARRLERQYETHHGNEAPAWTRGYCPDCGSMLTDRTTHDGNRDGRPAYCDTCDRQPNLDHGA